MGRLVERKGFQTVIRAMALVPDAECVVVGGPPEGLLETDPYARRLRALAESCGVADRVHLVGAVPREEMGRWYRSADLLVAAPWYEPFGLTPLEAMACGVPVVGTAVGGIRDTVVDGTTGDLVPARDPQRAGRRDPGVARRPDQALRVRDGGARAGPDAVLVGGHRRAAGRGLQRGGRRASPDPGGGLMPAGSLLDTHLTNLAAALVPYRRCESQLARWGADLAHRLAAGGRLLVAGNGGSAAEAQHLTAELVGKLHDDRQPLSAIALHAETSALTAIANDYGYTDVYARQVRAHGRPGDVLLLLSTSGSSANLVAAALAARDVGLTDLGAHRRRAQSARRRLRRGAGRRVPGHPGRPGAAPRDQSPALRVPRTGAARRAGRGRRPGGASTTGARPAGRAGPRRCVPGSRWCSTAGPDSRSTREPDSRSTPRMRRQA